jgi:transcriptional regulator with XRE-family HTH domain
MIEIYLDMEDVKEILAKNLAKLMELSVDCKSQNSLAKRSHVAQKTISNYLTANYDGFPSLEKVDLLARCFGLSAWQLIHPTMGNAEITAKEIAMYKKMRETLKQLQDQ